jgi:uncharacterized protein
MSIYVFVLEMKKHLRNLDGWLDKAVTHAQAKKFDPNVLLQARLSPDMFPLIRQVQAVCDQAKYAVSRVVGREPPSHPDTEQTIDDLKKRIATVIGYLDEYSEKDFADLANRSVTTPRWEGKSMTAINYFVEHAQPNFYFHYTTAYALLRHNGVDVGKRDYLGQLTWR